MRAGVCCRLLMSWNTNGGVWGTYRRGFGADLRIRIKMLSSPRTILLLFATMHDGNSLQVQCHRFSFLLYEEFAALVKFIPSPVYYSTRYTIPGILLG